MAINSAQPTSAAPGNEALTPLADQARVFGWRDHASLWFSLGVGLLVMQTGAYLLPALGLADALLAIVAGSLLGAGLLAWVARIGCHSGLASAGLMHAVFGSGFARLPIVLNIAQLIGWGAFELVVMRDATVAIAQKAGGGSGAFWPVAATLLWGALVALLISGSMVRLVRQVVARLALPLVLLSLLWLSWQFIGMAQSQGLAALWQRKGEGGMGVLPALDLVIAMPVSWLPLVADYARHGRNARSAFSATWTGYALANIWCYALGVLIALVLPSENLVMAVLLAQGGLMALSLILVDEVDNTYGDVYSGAVSAHSLAPRLGVRPGGLVLTAVCTVLALVLPMHNLEPFLLMLSSVFVPLFGVMLGRLSFGTDAVALMGRVGKAESLPITLWFAGIAVYHLCAQFAPDAGSALPALAFTFALAWLTRPARS